MRSMLNSLPEKIMILAFGFNLQANHDTKIKAPGALPQALCIIRLYLRPHQIVNCLGAVIIRRNRTDVGVSAILGVGVEWASGVVPLAATCVDCQIALPHAHITRPQVGELIVGLLSGGNDLTADEVFLSGNLASVMADALSSCQ